MSGMALRKTDFSDPRRDASSRKYGRLTPDAIGIVLKEAARRASEAIYNERFTFKATEKEGYSGVMDDVYTSADTKAQEIYLKIFKESLPGFGVIAEEDKLRWEPENGLDMYLTVDPLDGTKAFTRKQSQVLALWCRW